MPLMGPAVGALSGGALGAATGAIGGALSDLGVDDDFMQELAASLEPESATLFLLVRKMTTDKVLDAIKGSGGKVIKTSLDQSKEQELRAAAERAAWRAPGVTKVENRITISP